MKTLYAVLVLSSVLCTLSAQQNQKNFFPLGTGNRYVYLKTWSGLSGGGSRIEVSQIPRDTIAYGRIYYWAVNFPSINNEWIRLDPSTGSLYRLDKTGSCQFYDHEMIIDSLRAGLNDSTKNCLPSTSRSKCSDTSYVNIFGALRQKKRFVVNCSVPPVLTCSYYRLYLDSIGIYFYGSSSSGGGGGGSIVWELRGGIIGGMLFGDTSTAMGISVISAEVPEEHALLQNYPNPFNPNTMIRFQLTRLSDVLLNIYDAQGRLVSELVNGRYNAGTYETEFSGHGFSSGVYYYSLRTDGVLIVTKKMLLVK